jgi:hypothetical protein
MDYYHMEQSLQVLLSTYLPLSLAQKQRISDACLSVMLAGSSHLPQLAKWLPHQTQQASRERWLQRLLDAPYMQQEFVYAPLVKQCIQTYRAPCLHLLMDRSPLIAGESDYLCVSLLFRKRAIPLGWDVMAHGMSGYDQQIRLITRCLALLPDSEQIIFHGDNEFGGIPLLQFMRDKGCDVIVGQSQKHYYRYADSDWHQLRELSVKRSQNIYLSNIYLTKEHDYGQLNLVGFFHPRFKGTRRQQEVRYLATTLPITPRLLVTGKGRWGIECQFKDFKSAGWYMNWSKIRAFNRLESLLNLLSIAYLWATCLGRWLCKTGKRRLVDNHAQRSLSYFRIGWDWLVHQFRVHGLCPTLLRLYH